MNATNPPNHNAQCWNCWSPTHICLTCPKPLLSAATRERLRLLLNIAPPTDASYYIIIAARDLCVNCWSTNAHGAGTCPQPTLSTKAREGVRMKMGAVSTQYWRKVLQRENVEQGVYAKGKDGLKDMGMLGKWTKGLVEWMEGVQKDLGGGSQMEEEIAGDEEEEQDVGGGVVDVSEEDDAEEDSNEDEEELHLVLTVAPNHTPAEDATEPQPPSTTVIGMELLSEVQGLRNDITTGLGKLASEIGELTNHIKSTTITPEAHDVEDEEEYYEHDEEQPSRAEFNELQERMLAMESTFGRYIMANANPDHLLE